MGLFRLAVGLLAATFLPGVPALRAQHAPQPLTFSRDIAPILFRHCASCHQPDGPAPFPLVGYADVRPRASRIAAVVQSRQMPPWKPDPGVGDFVNARRLADSDIERIVSWVATGALEGDRADLPPAPPRTGGWQHGTPDLVLQLPAFELPGGGRDRFRNFVVPVPLRELRYVRGLEFHPNGPQIHHANIFVDPTTASQQLDDEDPQPGYEGLVPFSASFPDGHFLGWTPGQIAPLLPADQSWRLPAGSSLLVQMHLMAGEQTARVQATVGLYFSATPPARTPAMLRLGRQNLDIAPGDPAYVTTDSYVLPVEAQIHAVQPHAHQRAKRVKAWATLPDGTRRDIVSISNWDFAWQDQYRFANPFWLPTGTTLTAEYTFDNSASNRRNPDSPPRRVVWGQRSSDEMADVWIQLTTRSEADLRVLGAEVRRKMVLEDIAGHELELRSRPDSVIVRNDLAVLYLEVGRPAQAAVHFAAVSELQPQSAVAHYNLGAALEQSGREADAIRRYETALRLAPSYAKALKALATALLVSGRVTEAESRFRDLVSRDPGDAEALNNLGFCQSESGELAAAIRSFEAALALRPAYPDAHFNLARALVRRGASIDAVVHLRDALRARVDWVPALTELAWVQATASESRVRQPQEALRVAARAAVLTGRQDSDVLAALAAALAAAGQFDEAVRVANEALTLVTPDGRARLESHRGVYRSRRALEERER